MPTLATLLAFLPLVVAMQAVPGPDTMLVVSRGFGQGSCVALWTAFGGCRRERSSCRCWPFG
jgi:threonine/homoserine/homoserine lactone efflux protein